MLNSNEKVIINEDRSFTLPKVKPKLSGLQDINEIMSSNKTY